MSRRPAAIDEMVPLAERLRYLHGVRLVLAAVLVAYVTAVPEAVTGSLPDVFRVAAVYAAGTTAATVLWHLSRARGIASFGALLIADGVFMAWATWMTGGTPSPMRYLALIHLVTVALLASYRTAMKIAVWHSLLAVMAVYAARADILPGPAGSTPGSEFDQLVTFVTLAWAGVITTAMFAAVNERELRRRKVDLEGLARLAAALSPAATADTVVSALREALTGAFGFRRVEVVVADVDGHGEVDDVVVEAGRRRAPQLVRRLDAVRNPGLAALFGPAVNLIVAPLTADGRAVGVVVAEHGMRRGSRIERRVVTMVERFADQAALALRTTALLEELRRVATTDGLTGVANRRTFDEALSRELARTRRSGEPTSLVMVDVDHFKALNDRHGHQAGDQVLRRVAASLVSRSRGVDVVARYGGEEFAVVLPNCGTAQAVELAERLRLAVAGGGEPSVTASFGVATAPGDGCDPDELVRAADRALYGAKRDGRDRVDHAGRAGTVPVGAFASRIPEPRSAG